MDSIRIKAFKRIWQKVKVWFTGSEDSLTYEEECEFYSSLKEQGFISNDEYERITGTGKYRDRRTLK
jgi:hypothetical protein